MRSYESKVMFLHKAYKVYSNPRTNLLGYEELHNLLTYLAPGKIYEPTLEDLFDLGSDQEGRWISSSENFYVG